MEYRIIPCSEEDGELISERFWDEFGSLFPSAKDGEEELLIFKVTDDAGNIIGGCVLDVDAMKTAEFNALWVDERNRGKGMGTALIREAERAAGEKGCSLIVNAFAFDFQPAAPLFRKLGYRLAGVAEDWPRGHEGYVFIKCPHVPADFPETGWNVRPGTEEEGELIAEKLEAYNSSFVPRSHPYLDLDAKAVDGEGNLVGGCVAGVSGWDTLHVDLLWVDEPFRNRGIGTALLKEAEREAKERGAHLARTDAAAPLAAYFKRHGYAEYVRYEGDPEWSVLRKPLGLGLKRGTVAVVPHDDAWETDARDTIEKLKEILSGVLVDAQHVGSTAVTGICAKPIIDIAAGVSGFDGLLERNAVLEENGFLFRGQDRPGQYLYVRGEGDRRTHHIHAVIHGSEAWNDYLNFRDYLNAQPEEAKAYSDLKASLAERYPRDRNAYTAAKGDLIRGILARAREWREGTE